MTVPISPFDGLEGKCLGSVQLLEQNKRYNHAIRFDKSQKVVPGRKGDSGSNLQSNRDLKYRRQVCSASMCKHSLVFICLFFTV